jgi:hypothetical protein
VANKVSYIIQLKDQFSRVSEKINRQLVKAEKNSRKLNDRLKEQEKRFRGLRSQAKKFAVAGAAMTAAVTLPALMMSKSMIKAASDAEETANKFNAVFKQIAPEANKTADEFAQKFSLAGSTARKMIGDTGDLLVGFKFASKQALDLSTTVTKLALDLDSFQNFEGGVEGASRAITKALLGETESMKSLGVSIQQNTKEFRQQIKTVMATEKVTQRQAKALLILGQIQDQTQAATGDYLNTLNNSYQGAVRKNIQANKKFKESFGKILLPMATKMTNVMTKMAEKFSKLSPITKKVILVLVGLIAVLGPILVLLGGIALAMSVISLPVMLVVAGIAALIAIGVALWLNWEKIVKGAKGLWEGFASFMVDVGSKISSVFSAIWDGALKGLIFFINVAIEQINTLLAPLNFVAEKLGFGGVKIQQIEAPSTPTQQASGNFNGELTVKAENGTTVKKAVATNTGSANIGMNMVTANG